MIYQGNLRFLVPSESREANGMAHQVELDAYNGNGRCGCEHFQMRLEPLIRDNPGEILRCKHITQARDFFCDMMIKAVVRANPEQFSKRNEGICCTT